MRYYFLLLDTAGRILELTTEEADSSSDSKSSRGDAGGMVGPGKSVQLCDDGSMKPLEVV